MRSEQRSLAEKELPPGGLRRIWPVASLLVGYSPTLGDAPSSRLATGQIGRNERHRIYVHDHLAGFYAVRNTSKAVRHPSRKIIHILAGRGLFQEISGEEMRVVCRESDMAIQSPYPHHLSLVAHVTGVAGLA